MAHQDLMDDIRLDGVVTLVDAKHVEQHLDDKEMSEEAVNEAVEQIAYADRILLNKVDLVSHINPPQPPLYWLRSKESHELLLDHAEQRSLFCHFLINQPINHPISHLIK